MRATRFPLRAVPLRGNVSWAVQGKVSERLRDALRDFTLRPRAFKRQPASSLVHAALSRADREGPATVSGNGTVTLAAMVIAIVNCSRDGNNHLGGPCV